MTQPSDQDGAQRPDWVSQRAVAWVIDDAPVPADLAWTLLVIARRCDKDGRGSRQTIATIAEKTGKSVKQAQRDVVKLRALGLIVLGDQSLVAHLPVGKRPTVYDVPLHLKGPKPSKESRNKSGLKKGERVSPPTDGTPPLQGTPPMEGRGRPPMEGVPRPPMEGGQKNPEKNPMNNPSLSPRASSSAPDQRPPSAQEREREDEDDPTSTAGASDPRRQLAIERGAPKHLVEQIIEHIESSTPIDGLGWWYHTHGNGSLALQVKAALDALTAGPVCETCDGTRKVTGRNTYDQPTMHDCPACTPLTDEARKSFARSVQGHPPCPHNQAGGNVPMPGRGWMACATCRNLSGYVPTEFRDQQPRSSQRGGYVAPKVNLPPGQREASWERRRRQAAGMDVAPGHVRRPDGTTILKNSRDPEIDWEADF